MLSMRRLTSSLNMQTLMGNMITSIPWDLTTGTPWKENDWAMFDEPGRDLPNEFLHLQRVDRKPYTARIYRQVDNIERLQLASGNRPVEIPY
jgi:hypothetical protein